MYRLVTESSCVPWMRLLVPSPALKKSHWCTNRKELKANVVSNEEQRSHFFRLRASLVSTLTGSASEHMRTSLFSGMSGWWLPVRVAASWIFANTLEHRWLHFHRAFLVYSSDHFWSWACLNERECACKLLFSLQPDSHAYFWAVIGKWVFFLGKMSREGSLLALY